MITDENHPRMLTCGLELQARLKQFVGREARGSTLEAIGQVIYDHAVWARLTHDVEMPKLRAVVIPGYNTIELFRADLENSHVQRVLVGWVRKYPKLLLDDWRQIVQHTWPRYQPKQELDTK